MLLAFLGCHTKCPQLDVLNRREVFSQLWDQQKSMIMKHVGLVASEGCLPSLQTLCILTRLFSMCIIQNISLPFLITSPVLLNQGLTFMGLFNFNRLLRALSSNTVTSGFKTIQHINLMGERDTIQSTVSCFLDTGPFCKHFTFIKSLLLAKKL